MMLYNFLEFVHTLGTEKCGVVISKYRFFDSYIPNAALQEMWFITYLLMCESVHTLGTDKFGEVITKYRFFVVKFLMLPCKRCGTLHTC